MKAGQQPPPSLLALARDADTLVSSTRQRSMESAGAIAGGRDVRSDPLFVEAPLPSPPFPTWFRLPPRWWGVLSRICWWAFDYHDGQESVADARLRARQAANQLADQVAAGGDVMLVAHGFFNAMIGRALAARGWRKTLDQGFGYWAARRFEPPR